MIRKTMILSAACLTLVAAPAAAFEEEVVEFRFTASELTTEEGRINLLEKIEAHSMSACRVDSRIWVSDSRKNCARSLVRQYIDAIDNDELSQLANRESQRSFLLARR